ncbi:MAG: septum formation initiator family protein [Bacillota bacterium]
MILVREQLADPLPQKKQRVARPKKKLARSYRLKLSGMVLLGFVLGLTVILCQTRMTCIGFRLQELHKEIARVEAENQALDNAIHRLSAPERIEAVAVQRLGMIRPPEGALRVPPTGSLLAQAGSAPGSAQVPPVTAHGEPRHKQAGWLELFLEMLAEKSSGFLDRLNGEAYHVNVQARSQHGS